MLDKQLLNDKLVVLANELKDNFNRLTCTLKIKLLFAELFSDHFCYANSIPNNDYTKIHGDNEFVYDLIVVEEERNETEIEGEDFYPPACVLSPGRCSFFYPLQVF